MNSACKGSGKSVQTTCRDASEVCYRASPGTVFVGSLCAVLFSNARRCALLEPIDFTQKALLPVGIVLILHYGCGGLGCSRSRLGGCCHTVIEAVRSP